jgi:HK97 gp10 family phage protein
MAFNPGEITIEGIDDLARQIKSIPSDKVKRKELLKALRRQAKPLLQAIKDNTPVADKVVLNQTGLVDPGNLRDSFNIKAGRSKAWPSVVVGPRRGKKLVFKKKDGKPKKIKNDGWYVHFLLYGTANIQGKDFVKEASDKVLPVINVSASVELANYIRKKTKQITYIK